VCRKASWCRGFSAPDHQRGHVQVRAVGWVSHEQPTLFLILIFDFDFDFDFDF